MAISVVSNGHGDSKQRRFLKQRACLPNLRINKYYFLLYQLIIRIAIFCHIYSHKSYWFVSTANGSRQNTESRIKSLARRQGGRNYRAGWGRGRDQAQQKWTEKIRKTEETCRGKGSKSSQKGSWEQRQERKALKGRRNSWSDCLLRKQIQNDHRPQEKSLDQPLPP